MVGTGRLQPASTSALAHCSGWARMDATERWPRADFVSTREHNTSLSASTTPVSPPLPPPPQSAASGRGIKGNSTTAKRAITYLDALQLGGKTGFFSVSPATLMLIACVVVVVWLVFVPLWALLYDAFTEDTGFGPG